MFDIFELILLDAGLSGSVPSFLTGAGTALSLAVYALNREWKKSDKLASDLGKAQEDHKKEIRDIYQEQSVVVEKVIDLSSRYQELTRQGLKSDEEIKAFLRENRDLLRECRAELKLINQARVKDGT
jgi:hypothetical protein